MVIDNLFLISPILKQISYTSLCGHSGLETPKFKTNNISGIVDDCLPAKFAHFLLYVIHMYVYMSMSLMLYRPRSHVD